MQKETYNKLRHIIKAESGITLDETKEYLVESRLRPLLESYKLKDFEALLPKLGDKALVKNVIEAITVHETFFFRDQVPFDMFKNAIMPELVYLKKMTNIRILCAACSSGQEPYSLAIILNEEAGRFKDVKCEIVGIDISEKIVENARKGEYNQIEIQRGLPANYIIKYFDKINYSTWRLKDEVRDKVQFRQFNLMNDMSALGKFDIIFCRNVLIYFDYANKAKILGNLYRIIQPHGFLCLGNAETLIGVDHKFKVVTDKRMLYRP